MNDDTLDPDMALPFPIEFVILGAPRSHQSTSAKGRESWKRTVSVTADAHAKALRDYFFLDHRPLAVTIFYFPPAKMDGDVDNIVKLIVDGMNGIIYPDDRVLEQIVVQKFEPGVRATFLSLTPTLKSAVEADRPVVYIRVDDDLRWRQVP